MGAGLLIGKPVTRRRAARCSPVSGQVSPRGRRSLLSQGGSDSLVRVKIRGHIFSDPVFE